MLDIEHEFSTDSGGNSLLRIRFKSFPTNDRVEIWGLQVADLTFEPPGPGAWTLNNLHYPRPLSRYAREFHPAAVEEGTRRGGELYGVLYDLKIELVNGFWYIQQRPVNGGQNSTAAAGLELQLRLSQLKETYEIKRWRDDLSRWDNTFKPNHQEINKVLQAVEPAELDDDALLDHLETCREAFREGVVLHSRMTPCAYFPVSDFLAQVSDWTGRSPDELLALLDGASPESAGAHDELQRLVEAIRESSSATNVVESGKNPSEVIESLRTAGGTVEQAAKDWLEIVGYRPVSGWDLPTPYALEQPETLVRTLRSVLEGRSDGPADHDPTDQVATVRQEVPAEHRDRFDELHEDARSTHRVNDERDFVDMPSRGLTRRALLEVGRRLTERGRIHAPEHAVDLTHEEIVGAFTGEGTPSADEVAARVEYRRTHDSSEAPDQLGEEDTSDPFADQDLPDVAHRFLKGGEVLRQVNSADSRLDSQPDTAVVGQGASPGSAQGPARVISGPEEFSEIQEGDILVTEMTSPGYNVILPLIEGVVTDTGGKLSHPAIVAREFGLPAVVGCEDATDRINDGDHIAVDGDKGTVQFL